MSDVPPTQAENQSPEEAAPTVTASSKRSFLDLIIRFCLEKKLVVFLLVIVVIGAGVLVAPFDWEIEGLHRFPVAVDAIPDIGENQQIVFTEWMGRSPQDVEDQITYPLTSALQGLPGVKTIRSSSMFGFSSIYVIFDEEIEFYWSRSRVLEKLNSLPVGTLPEGVQPALGPDATALGQVFWYTLEGRDPDGKPAGGWDLHELRSAQDWLVRYALTSAKGISEVASIGGFVQEYQIDVDPDAMRANGVGLDDIIQAVRMSNVDVGASTIEINRVEYVVRGLGFIKQLSDLEHTVVKVHENVPISVKDIGKVALGPALRRGALDKEGAEAVGGVAVVRYGFNPLEAIKSIKEKIDEIAPGLPTKAVIDYHKTTQTEVEAFAEQQGFEAYTNAKLNQDAWIKWLRSTIKQREDRWPDWVTTSRITIVPFYDRTGLIYETLGTLKTALTEEILITVIVVIVMMMHLRSSLLISALLPLAVLMCFIAMKVFGVDANIVALSGIVIAIGTMVDMGVILCENILKHLDEAEPDENRLEVIFRASREVGSAVLTAVATTVISFLPVFFMTASEGKLFKPLAFTKTFALIASVIVALTIIPPMAHLLFGRKWFPHVTLPKQLRTAFTWFANGIAVLFVTVVLTSHWLPLGPELGLSRNLTFVLTALGSVLLFFQIFQRYLYAPILCWCLDHKLLFLLLPALLVMLGLTIWLGPHVLLGPINRSIQEETFASQEEIDKLLDENLLEERIENEPNVQRKRRILLWTNKALSLSHTKFEEQLEELKIENTEPIVSRWYFPSLRNQKWGEEPGVIKREPFSVKLQWTLAKMWNGLGKEFMPSLDEGSFLYMPSTMVHASIGEALEVMQIQDKRLASIPEVETVVGKLGRVESPLDPAPISMFETVINYKPEYKTDKAGHRINFRYDEDKQKFLFDKHGDPIQDSKGRPFRQWRDHIKTPHDIWEEIKNFADIPGTKISPELQPIATRIVMLQSGMRAPMGVKISGPDLETIEQVGLQIEQFLKQVPSVNPPTVNADRIVGKPYIEIDINREAIARYGMHIRQVQDVIEVAIGGRRITTTVEGRERYPVRIRYPRELRDQIETLGRILVPASDGAQIPLTQLAEIRYIRGPQVIKSEDSVLVGHVTFDMKPGHAEVDVVEECKRFLVQKENNGEFIRPAGVQLKFAGTYESQKNAQETLALVLPLALLVIFLILYLQFNSVPTSLLVFSGIIVAWSGGFLMVWLYGQPWFLDFEISGTNMRTLFQVHSINLSVAIWVGFLALFGIATDDGVVISTYLDQSFARSKIETIEDARKATVEAGLRRVRPCLMTTATTVLALLPVLTSTGRGSDIMVPMAIPSFGGMLIAILTMFVVPVLYCMVKEFKLKLHIRDELFREHPKPS
jgi:Cu(I)/Ag(I) efflux system membrane protein CusA/SilA